MARKSLFRKNINPQCVYCARSNKLNDRYAACKFFGVVTLTHKCRLFKYDPLKRIPPKPAVIRGTFTDQDFLINDAEESKV